jgi:hypothetical protein
MNKTDREVEVKFKITKKQYDSLTKQFDSDNSIDTVVKFDDKIDLFWDVSTEGTEAFVRCRYTDCNGSNPEWLIKVQPESFNDRIELGLPLGLASSLHRHHDYEIKGYGQVWRHKASNCTLSLYYVYELASYFFEVESEGRDMNEIHRCHRLLGIDDGTMDEQHQSLFSMVKTNKLTKKA